MKKDNALRKALTRNKMELPYGFENRVMRQILLEVDRKSRLSYHRALGLVAFVSLALIAGLLVVLNLYFNINMLDVLAGLRMPAVDSISIVNDQSRPIFAFSIYIGVLMLFLLGMDHLFRNRFRRSKKH